MKNICVVNVNWLGDAIFSIPVFKAIKSAYPGSRVVCVCVPRVKEVLEHCPYIDELFVYDEKGRDRFLWRKFAVVLKLRTYKFDIAFLLHRSMTRALLAYLAGIPERVGFSKCKGLLTHPVAVPEGDMHRSDRYLKVVESYGIKVIDRSCELSVEPALTERIDAALKSFGVGQGPVAVLNTGGNWDLKRWPARQFVLLARRLVEEFHYHVVFAGGPKDRDPCQALAREAGVPVTVLAGATTLGESLALYKSSSVVVSADTGPLHLAHAVGANVVGIFGPTRQEVTGPRGIGQSRVLFKAVGCNNSPCYLLSCRDNKCMQAVTLEDVLEAVRAISS